MTDNALANRYRNLVKNFPGHRIFRTVSRRLPENPTIFRDQVDNAVCKAQFGNSRLGDIPDNVIQGDQRGLTQRKLVQDVQIAMPRYALIVSCTPRPHPRHPVTGYQAVLGRRGRRFWSSNPKPIHG